MNYFQIEQFAQNLVVSMSAEQVKTFHRHQFIAKFSHPDFNGYSDFLELVNLVESYVADRMVDTMAWSNDVAA